MGQAKEATPFVAPSAPSGAVNPQRIFNARCLYIRSDSLCFIPQKSPPPAGLIEEYTELVFFTLNGD
jgi:hypothetical protein